MVGKLWKEQINFFAGNRNKKNKGVKSKGCCSRMPGRARGRARDYSPVKAFVIGIIGGINIWLDHQLEREVYLNEPAIKGRGNQRNTKHQSKEARRTEAEFFLFFS